MDKNSTGSALSPGASVMFSILTAIVGFVIIGPIVGGFLSGFFYDGSLTELIETFQTLKLSEKIKLPFLIMQACSTTFGLMLTPLIYLKSVEKISLKDLFGSLNPIMAALTVVCVFLFMLPNSVFIELNNNFVFPGQLDNWIREKEETAAAFTRFITTFQSFGQYLFGIFVIAVLPAIGEELAFRGMIQPAIQRLTKNVHLAVWLAAILFSAFHFQFLGFVPRLLLGVFFGYLMAWSGNLWLPIIAHFANNAFGVTFIYLKQLGITDFDAESPESAPVMLVIPGTLLFIFLTRIIYKNFNSGK